MGACCSTETGGLAREAATETFDITSLNLVQIQHVYSGSYIVCGTPDKTMIGGETQQPNYEGQPLMFKDKLAKNERIHSYFQLLKNGLIKHYATGLYIMSEGTEIQNGYALALKRGNIAADATEKEVATFASDFSFVHTQQQLLLHTKSGMYIQTEGNSVHNGAILYTYPLTVEKEGGGGYTRAAQYLLNKVDYTEVQADIDYQRLLDQEARFAKSSDGQAVAAAASGVCTDDIIVRDEVFYADPAIIKIGRNRLLLATYSDPVKNLSLCSSSGMFSLVDGSEDDETWSIQMTVCDGPRPKQKDKCYGTKLRIINKNGLCMSCTEEGDLLAITPPPPSNDSSSTSSSSSSSSSAAASVWNILLGERNLFYISNNAYPYVITRYSNKIKLIPQSSKPEDNMFWNVYDA